MKKKFEAIENVYNEFRRQRLKQGEFMMKDTGIGYWGITPISELFELFTKTELQKHKKFIDLGSGDGRATVTASLFTSAEGIEFDEELHKFSELLAKKVNAKVKLHNKNFLEHPLSGYDYIFIHPDNPISEKLEHKLLKEMHPKAKFVVFNFRHHPLTLKKQQTHDIQGTYVTIFTK